MLSMEWSADRVFLVLIAPTIIAGAALLFKDHRKQVTALIKQ